MSDDKEHWVTKIQSTKAYRSVYAESKATERRSSMDWRVLVAAIVIIVIVIAGVVVALRSIEPKDGWADLTEMRVANDEAFLYILLKTSGKGQPDWNSGSYRIAIDTYDANRGSRTLPPPFEASTATGVEFFLDLRGPDASHMLAIQGYDPFDGEEPIFSSKERDPGFRILNVQTNRERFGRDGQAFPSVAIERGMLRFADPEEPSRVLADVATGAGSLEIRIPWSLLNVTDPSTRSVIHSLERGREKIEIRKTEGFRIYAFSFERNEEGKPELADQIPTGGGTAPLYSWATWERPSYVLEPKAGLSLVSEAMNTIPDRPPDKPVAVP